VHKCHHACAKTSYNQGLHQSPGRGQSYSRTVKVCNYYLMLRVQGNPTKKNSPTNMIFGSLNDCMPQIHSLEG